MRRSLPIIGLALLLAACGNQTSTSAVTTPNAEAHEHAGVNVSSLALDPGMRQDLNVQATDPYNITLNFAAGSDPAVVTAMQNAAARWEGIVTQGLPSVTGNIAANSCGSNAAFQGTIDDILIFTGSKAIDGPGGILAQSGPCSIRSSSGLTTYSTLIFDSADIASFGSQLTDIAVHEMGHSLGIGSLWSNKGLVTGASTTNPTYTGTNGKREWVALGGTGNVPVENQGGAGTKGAHWRETTFGTELMTGYLNNGVNPLSRLSIAGLQDLGYSVTYAPANSYSLPASLNAQGLGGVELREEIVTPKYRVE